MHKAVFRRDTPLHLDSRLEGADGITQSHTRTHSHGHTHSNPICHSTLLRNKVCLAVTLLVALYPLSCVDTHTHMHRHTHTQSHKFSTIMPQTQKSMCGWDPSHPSGAHTDADLKPGIHSAVPGLLSQTKCLWSYFQNDSPAPQSNKGSGFVVTTVL